MNGADRTAGWSSSSWANLALVVMISGNGGIRAVSLCFRCQAVDQQAAEDSAHDRNNEEKPGLERRRSLAKQGWFSTWRGRMVASHSIERKAKNHLTGRKKDHGSDACNDANDQRQTE
jgi:hypothetical protein